MLPFSCGVTAFERIPERWISQAGSAVLIPLFCFIMRT
jgi:hypothetical protein